MENNLSIVVVRGEGRLSKTLREKKIPIGQISKYVVTGILYGTNKRFINRYDSFYQAMGINLWNGSVWAELENGKRKLLKRVRN